MTTPAGRSTRIIWPRARATSDEPREERDPLEVAAETLHAAEQHGLAAAIAGVGWALVAAVEELREAAGDLGVPSMAHGRAAERILSGDDMLLWELAARVLVPSGWEIRILDGDPWLLHDGCLDGPGVYAEHGRYGLFLGPDTLVERIPDFDSLATRLTDLGYLPAG